MGVSNLKPGRLTVLSKLNLNFERGGCDLTLATLSHLNIDLIFITVAVTTVSENTSVWTTLPCLIPTGFTKSLRKLLQVITATTMQVTNL